MLINCLIIAYAVGALYVFTCCLPPLDRNPVRYATGFVLCISWPLFIVALFLAIVFIRPRKVDKDVPSGD